MKPVDKVMTAFVGTVAIAILVGIYIVGMISYDHKPNSSQRTTTSYVAKTTTTSEKSCGDWAMEGRIPLRCYGYYNRGFLNHSCTVAEGSSIARRADRDNDGYVESDGGLMGGEIAEADRLLDLYGC